MAIPFERPWSGLDTSGRCCLSFVNTLDWRLRDPSVELLVDYDALLRWARTAGILTPAEATRLRATVGARPHTPARLLGHARRVREAMAEVFLALCRGTVPPAPAGERLDRACREARAARRLAVTTRGATWTWRAEEPEPMRPAWGAALDAAALLTSPEVARVRLCEDAECGWFFLDASRNASRRWCSMESCGNRNKARTFYRRRKGHRTGDAPS